MFSFAEISLRRKRKSIWGLNFLGLAHGLLDAFQEERSCCFENLSLIVLIQFHFVFMGPVAEIRYVRTVAEVTSEAAAPTDEILRLNVRR
jgi:hypothetical protein